jgi:hypothetical protein
MTFRKKNGSAFKMTYQSASVMIHPFIENGSEGAVITTLYSKEKRLGHATMLMGDICHMADEKSWWLLLEARQFGKHGGLGFKELKLFYGHFGFVSENPETPRIMTRDPRRKNKAYNRTEVSLD